MYKCPEGLRKKFGMVKQTFFNEYLRKPIPCGVGLTSNIDLL